MDPKYFNESLYYTLHFTVGHESKYGVSVEKYKPQHPEGGEYIWGVAAFLFMMVVFGPQIQFTCSPVVV